MIVLETRIFDHANVAQRIADLSKTLPHNIHVISVIDKRSDFPLQIVRPIIRVQAVKFILITVEDARLSLQQVHDLLIEQESFAEVLDLLPNEFVKLVHHTG